MNNFLTTVAFLAIGYVTLAQVGIGNTDPNATLDISATSVATPSNTDGILIPRVDEFPTINPTAAQDGMMLFLTGNGTPTKGFYYWDQDAGPAAWVAFTGGGNDADFYEIGTSTAPNNITDDIFTEGRVALGKTTVGSTMLDIDNTNRESAININGNSSLATSYGLHNILNGSSIVAGVFNEMIGSSTGKVGIRSEFTGATTGGISVGANSRFESTGSANNFGVYNTFISSSSTGAIITGVRNWFHATGSYTGNLTGVANDLENNDDGIHIGVDNNIIGTGSGEKYGTRTIIPLSAGGLQYGIYSDVRNATGYAGYFLGRTSLGNGTTNRYLMPATDGTNGQVMTTNGLGNVSFQDAVEDADWYVQSTTNTPSGITDNIYTQGNVEIDQGILTLDPIDNQSGGLTLSKNVSNNTVFTYRNIEATTNITGSTNVWQIQSSFSGNGTGSRASNISRFNGTGNATTTGLLNLFNNDNAATMTGVSNQFPNTSNGIKTGMLNSINLTAQSSTTYGIRNTITGGTGTIYGTNTTITNGNGTQHGTYINLVNGTGTRYGDRILLSGTGGGVDYGVYSDVEDLANGFAGYFQGRFSLGNTGSNRYIMPAADGTNGQTMQTDGAGNVSWVTPSSSVTASNGLTEVTDDIQLGGTLTQNTTINQGNFDMHYQLGSGSTADFQVIRGGGSNLITAGNDGYILLGDTASLPNPRLQVTGGATFGSYMADFYNNAANPDAAAVSIRVRTSVPHTGNYIGFFKNETTLTGHINGNGSGGVNYSTVSDRRLKTSILDIHNSLELVNKIQPRIYEYKTNIGNKEYGFIAQELQKIYPQAVFGDPNGDVKAEPMMVDYGRLTPILTAAIQELNNENQIIKDRLKTLESENENLKLKLEAFKTLEARLSALENDTNSFNLNTATTKK